MNFQWTDYLDLAKKLEKSTRQVGANTLSESEAILRTCISRAYYASFHVSKEYLKQKYPDLIQEDERFNKGNSHVKVINLLNIDEDERIKTVSQRLLKLRRARTDADYFLSCKSLKTIQDAKNQARDALTLSYKIIETLKLSLKE